MPVMRYESVADKTDQSPLGFSLAFLYNEIIGIISYNNSMDIAFFIPVRIFRGLRNLMIGHRKGRLPRWSLPAGDSSVLIRLRTLAFDPPQLPGRQSSLVPFRDLFSERIRANSM